MPTPITVVLNWTVTLRAKYTSQPIQCLVREVNVVATLPSLTFFLTLPDSGHRSLEVPTQSDNGSVSPIPVQLLFEAAERRSDDVAVMDLRADGSHRFDPQPMDPIDVVV